MHPQLTSDKRIGATVTFSVSDTIPVQDPSLNRFLIVCQEFIDALEACHAQGWSRFTGACNQAKHDLNMCLRRERIERTTRNREEAKVRRQKVEQVWNELHEDD